MLGSTTDGKVDGDYQIALGFDATCEASNQMTIGSSNSDALTITQVRPGRDAKCDLGSATKQFKDMYAMGHVINPIATALTANPSPLATPITRFNTTSGAITCTLPASASSQGKTFVITLETFVSNLTITAAGADTIGLSGGTTHVLSTVGDAVRITCIGTNWCIT